MPGFGKAGISFLICIRLIVQGLAKKYRSEAESTGKSSYFVISMLTLFVPLYESICK